MNTYTEDQFNSLLDAYSGVLKERNTLLSSVVAVALGLSSAALMQTAGKIQAGHAVCSESTDRKVEVPK